MAALGSMGGGMFNSMLASSESKSPVMTSEEGPKIQKELLPTSIMETRWEEIADNIGEFLDFVNLHSPIRREIIGSEKECRTEKMHNIIRKAQKDIENRIRMMSSNGTAALTIKESVFLAVMARILADVIKHFGQNKK